MTYEEAIKDIIRFCTDECNRTSKCEGCGMHYARIALAKQIPKKPIVEVEAEADHDRTYTYYYCPNCSDMLNPDTKPHHCKCGQKLEWK